MVPAFPASAHVPDALVSSLPLSVYFTLPPPPKGPGEVENHISQIGPLSLKELEHLTQVTQQARVESGCRQLSA